MGMGLGLSLRLGNVAASGGGSPVLSSRKVVLFIGDSTFVGVGAGSGGTTDVNGSRPFSAPLKARDYLLAAGIPATAANMVADNNNGITSALLTGYRPELVVTSGTLLAATLTPTVGGVAIRLGNTTTALTYTSSEAFDAIEMWQTQVSGGGTMGVNVDGGSVTNYSAAAGSTQIVKNTMSGLTLATHAVKFQPTASSAYLPIFNCFNSVTPAFNILNAGARNWTSADWVVATNPNSPLPTITAIAPDAAVINLGINDYRNPGVTIATFKANVQTIINTLVAAKPACKIFLVVPTPIQTYDTTTDAWSPAAVLQAYIDLQAANAGSVLIDTPLVIFQAGLGSLSPGTTVGTRVNTWSNLNGLGYMHDALHPFAPPYAAEGAAIGAAIKAAYGL
jgi:lysophospholipase L1-like esterase